MTRLLKSRFHRLAAVLVIGFGTVGLAIGTAAAASAAPTWGQPTPTPIYTPPPQQHHQPKATCEFSLLTEHDTVADQRGADEGDQYGQPQSAPSYTDPAGAPSSAPYTYPTGPGQYNDHQPQTDQVEVVQLAEFCVFEGKWGGDQVKVWDVSAPYAWVDEGHGQMEPDPGYLPPAIRSALPN